MSCMLKRPLEIHFPSPDLGGGSWSCHGGEVLQGGDQTTRGEHAPGTVAACHRPYMGSSVCSLVANEADYAHCGHAWTVFSSSDENGLGPSLIPRPSTPKRSKAGGVEGLGTRLARTCRLMFASLSCTWISAAGNLLHLQDRE